MHEHTRAYAMISLAEMYRVFHCVLRERVHLVAILKSFVRCFLHDTSFYHQHIYGRADGVEHDCSQVKPSACMAASW